jgi:hypothetical protein
VPCSLEIDCSAGSFAGPTSQEDDIHRRQTGITRRSKCNPHHVTPAYHMDAF